MDGTLLDLHFDSHFWLNVVPEQLALTRNITLDEAKADMHKRYQAVSGQIQWYCLDYWQEQLNLPIMELKRQTQHLIKVREDVPHFLTELKKAGKELILLFSLFLYNNLHSQHRTRYLGILKKCILRLAILAFLICF